MDSARPPPFEKKKEILALININEKCKQPCLISGAEFWFNSFRTQSILIFFEGIVHEWTTFNEVKINLIGKLNGMTILMKLYKNFNLNIISIKYQ